MDHYGERFEEEEEIEEVEEEKEKEEEVREEVVLPFSRSTTPPRP